MDYKRRVSSMARILGCPEHAEVLVCRSCDAPEPLPEPLHTGLDALIDAIVARVGREGVQAAWRRLPAPPPLPPCRRCGGHARQCARCLESFGRRLFQEIGLTDAEQHALDGLLATCRRHDRTPPRYLSGKAHGVIVDPGAI